MEFQKFVDVTPSDQAAIDIFKNRWASALPGGLEAGSATLFEGDPRPEWALKAFSSTASSFNGAKILELGPLEAGHTYKLEQLGGDITAIEGNAEAYLKCLIVKDIFKLKAKFLVGNFVKHMEATNQTYDLIFASGVLYHMTDPLKLISLICRASNYSFIWSHYYDADVCENFKSDTDQYLGFSCRHHRLFYPNRDSGTFWGGLAESARWLAKDDIISALKHFGHNEVEIIADAKNGQHGPSMSLVSRRTN